MRWKLDIFTVQSALISWKDAHKNRRGHLSDLCFWKEKHNIGGVLNPCSLCVSPKENYSLKQTPKSKYMKQLQDSIEFLKLIFTWMPNPEEKAKSLQSRFCTQAHITRLQFAQ